MIHNTSSEAELDHHHKVAIAFEELSRLLASDSYLREILAREAVDTSSTAPVHRIKDQLLPLLRNWAGLDLMSVYPSGSFAKGTAIRSGTDIDLFLSISPDIRRPLRMLHEALIEALRSAGYEPRRQNVSINIRFNGFSVDLVPAHRHNPDSEDHSLYLRRHDTWIKTNIAHQIAFVRGARLSDEIRILKLWRNQQSLDFPSFYLELVAIRALGMGRTPHLTANIFAVFEYLRDAFAHARFTDPGNGNNVLSDTLSVTEKHAIVDAARAALVRPGWNDFVV